MSKLHLNRSTIISVFIFFIGILLTMSLVRNINTILSANAKISQTQDRLASLESKNEQLKQEVDRIGSSGFKEQQARDSLGMAREGEVVVILPPEDILRKLSSVVETQSWQELPKPNWRKWMELFF